MCNKYILYTNIQIIHKYVHLLHNFFRAIESIKTKKKVLQFVFKTFCERSKYILSLDKKIKNLPPKCLDIVKL